MWFCRWGNFIRTAFLDSNGEKYHYLPALSLFISMILTKASIKKYGFVMYINCSKLMCLSNGEKISFLPLLSLFHLYDLYHHKKLRIRNVIMCIKLVSLSKPMEVTINSKKYVIEHQNFSDLGFACSGFSTCTPASTELIDRIFIIFNY
jgi:hypothetical protein